MKNLTLVLCLGLAGQPALPAGAPVAAPDTGPAPAGDPDRFTRLPALYWDDTKAVFTAPGRWGSREWTQAGLWGAAVLGTGLVLDRPLRAAFQRSETPSRDHLADTISQFGDSYAFVILGGRYLYGEAFAVPEAKAVAIDGVGASFIADVLINPALKEAVGRARPHENRDPDYFKPFSNRDSFPSGHTTQAFLVAAVISGHSPEPWVPVVSYGLAALVGVSRMELQAHFASDVLAGALLGTTVGKLVVYTNQGRRAGKAASWDVRIQPQLAPRYAGLVFDARF